MLYVSFEGNRFLVLFRALSREAEEDAAKEMMDRLAGREVANDNAPSGLRDFLTD